jgi:hypothetical protein
VVVVVAALLAVALLTMGAGSTLRVDAWRRRWYRPDLSERLHPHRQRSVADEGSAWVDGLRYSRSACCPEDAKRILCYKLATL